ncbi:MULTISPECIES: hypothetical protein [unclassified Myroides]|uniref:hypothetical protein n=1 Tax=unclassified Myroides TaxID=2642485 RepID=UPI003D2F887D
MKKHLFWNWYLLLLILHKIFKKFHNEYKKTIILFLCLLGFSCNQDNSLDPKNNFTHNSTKNHLNKDYETIRLAIYKNIKENWDKNLEEVEKYTLEAFNKNENFVRTQKVNNNETITINITYKFNYSKQVSSLLSELYSKIYNSSLDNLKSTFLDQKNRMLTHKNLTKEDYEILYPIYASFEANIDFILSKYEEIEVANKNSLTAFALTGDKQNKKSWLDCMLEEQGNNIGRGIAGGAITGAIGGAYTGATGGTVVLPLVGTATGAVGGGVLGGALGAGSGGMLAFAFASIDCFTRTSKGSGNSDTSCAITIPYDPNDPRFKGVNPIKPALDHHGNGLYKEETFKELKNNLEELQEVSTTSNVIIILN